MSPCFQQDKASSSLVRASSWRRSAGVWSGRNLSCWSAAVSCPGRCQALLGTPQAAQGSEAQGCRTATGPHGPPETSPAEGQARCLAACPLPGHPRSPGALWAGRSWADQGLAHVPRRSHPPGGLSDEVEVPSLSGLLHAAGHQCIAVLAQLLTVHWAKEAAAGLAAARDLMCIPGRL